MGIVASKGQLVFLGLALFLGGGVQIVFILPILTYILFLLLTQS